MKIYGLWKQWLEMEKKKEEVYNYLLFQNI